MLSMQPRTISVGSINVDFQVRSERWPEGGETLLTRDFLRAGGGKAANRAFLARRLGAATVLFGCVGDDDFGDEALAPLQGVGVDVSRVGRARGQPTGLSMIVVRADGDKTILLAPNANMHASADDAARVRRGVAEAESGDVVSLDLEVPELMVNAAAQAARERQLVTVLDPSPAERMRDELYEASHCLTPNHGEAQRLAGFAIDDERGALRAARLFVERGAKSACVKLKAGGCAVFSSELESVIHAPKVEVVDKTGAGDAFAGALAVALLERQPLEEAARFAVFCSTLATTRYGSQAAYPDRARLEQALAAGEVK
jgi:ribokinase